MEDKIEKLIIIDEKGYYLNQIKLWEKIWDKVMYEDFGDNPPFYANWDFIEEEVIRSLSYKKVSLYSAKEIEAISNDFDSLIEEFL